MKNKNIRVSKILKYAGAIVAYLIGAGFASGQEAMQYFSAYGVNGALGAGILTLLFYTWFSSTIMKDGYKLKLNSSTQIFKYYCGKYIGRFYEIYTPIFLFLVFIVMLSGAGALLNEFYDFNLQTGRIIMAVLALVTVLSGMNKIVNVISKLGPVIILFAIAIGLINIFLNPAGILEADQIIASIDIRKAAPSWYISGIIFPAMGCLIIAPFLAEMGKTAETENEAKIGGFVGGLAFSLAVMIMSFGIMATINELYLKNIPALFIAEKMFLGIGLIFSIILFFGIFTTAVPMLWLSSNALYGDEKNKKFKLLVVILTIVAFIGSQFEFATLVNILYPISGYLGILLFIFMLIKQIRNAINSKKSYKIIS